MEISTALWASNNNNNNNAPISVAQNKLPSVVLTTVQTNMSGKSLQKMDAERMLAGNTRGSATAKLHVPSTVLVLGTMRHQLSRCFKDHNIAREATTLLFNLRNCFDLPVQIF